MLDGKRDSLKILRDLEVVAEWKSFLLVLYLEHFGLLPLRSIYCIFEIE
jgi:hypothetical protein